MTEFPVEKPPVQRNAVVHWKARMRLPAIVAPMFLVSGPELVLAACRAGLMGCFPGPNARTSVDLRNWFKQIKAGLSALEAAGATPGPWAFNMITHKSYGRFDEEVALLAEFQPPLVISALGGPQRLLPVVHSYGGMVFADVIDVDYARKAVDKGADGLVLVCSGAGGHTGQYSPFAFLDEVRQFWDGPVVLGGSISNGRAIRAIEVLGADFAYMGTRFIATPESLVSDAYRQMVVDSSIGDLVQTRAITGANANFMMPSVRKAGFPVEDLQQENQIDFSDDMLNDSKAWKHIWSAGQGLGSTTIIEPLADIVDVLEQQYLRAGG